MPVTATAWLRPMRGGAQTHLLRASDGHHYVVKFSNNPQGLRTLVNEWLAQRILSYLQIPCPPVEVIDIPPALIDANPEMRMKRGDKSIPPAPGWHFGSRFPGDPNAIAIYDIIADVQILACRNLHHFAAALVFDKWTCNSDSRQSIFYRAKLIDVIDSADAAEEPHYATRGLVVSMIDHGFCFNSVYWDFPDAPGHGLYFRPAAYSKINGWRHFEPWLDRVQNFPESVLDRALSEIPRAWLLDTDEPQIHSLCERLLHRCSKVAGLIERTREKTPHYFPNWR